MEGFSHISAPDQQNLRKLFQDEDHVDPNMYPAVDEHDVSDTSSDDWVDGIFKKYY